MNNIRDFKKIFKEMQINGFFSEYLPPCFKLTNDMLSSIPSENCDLIPPLSFTMSRYNNNNMRRNIFIPEFGSYLILNNFIRGNDIIKEVSEFIDENTASFSKVIMADGSIMLHDQCYNGIDINHKSANQSNYIDNIVNKIIKASGAKSILKIDIANCFSSVYTHYIPSILLGYENANYFYIQKIKNGGSCEINKTYEKYVHLDKIIRKQNLNKTNGLLVGPLFSKLIV